jgi:hypothetical protein
VNKKTRHIVNWMLIALVAMLPLRNVMALEQLNCQMHDQSSVEVTGHDMHALHGMSASSDMAANTSATNASDDCCCCDNGMKCNGDCGLGLGASFIVQSGFTVPVINGTTFHVHDNNSLVVAEFSPPIRPPQAS